MSAAFIGTQINDSATITAPAAAAVDYRGKAIVINSSGAAALAGAGAVAIGVGIMSNDEVSVAGNDVDIQVKDIGRAVSGAAIAIGQELTSNASGQLVPATAGQFVVATALEAAAAAGTYIKVQITKYMKAAAEPGAELPAVTADNNGQVLTVVEGAWAAAAVPTELPAVTAEDNGDVLTVVEGAWANAALPTT